MIKLIALVTLLFSLSGCGMYVPFMDPTISRCSAQYTGSTCLGGQYHD
jgi:hypothetical protein